MKRIKTLGLALMMIFIMGAIASATASAVEPTKMLPEPSEKSPVSFEDKSGAGALETVGGEKVQCTSDESKGQATSPNLGTFDVLFLGCKAAGIAPCKGLKDEMKESVLATGPFHWWLALLGGKLIGVIVILLEEVHFECNFIIEELVLVKGCVAGQLTPTDVLVEKATVAFKQTKGVQNIIKVLPENSTKEIECKLESKKGTGKFEQSGEETTEEIFGFKQGGKAITVLFMNK